jgi:hypothetical protein
MFAVGLSIDSSDFVFRAGLAGCDVNTSRRKLFRPCPRQTNGRRHHAKTGARNPQRAGRISPPATIGEPISHAGAALIRTVC